MTEKKTKMILKYKKDLRTMEDLKKFLIDFFKDRNLKVYLFGSRARGDNTPFSDIDIGILTEEDISSDLTILREILEESNLPYKVDLVNLSSNKELLKIILAEGKRWI